MCTAPPHCRFSGRTDLVGLHSAQPLTGTSVQVVRGMLLPSTGQCQFLQAVLEARTEEGTLGFAIVVFQFCFANTHGINYKSVARRGLEEAVFSRVEL